MPESRISVETSKVETVTKYYQSLAKKKAYSNGRFKALQVLVRLHREEFLKIVQEKSAELLPTFQQKTEATLKSLTSAQINRIADRIETRKRIRREKASAKRKEA